LEADVIPDASKSAWRRWGMLNFIVIAIIFLSIILLSIINIVFALKCPKCRKWFALVWQERQQRSVCKYCAWLAFDKDWHPPDKGAFKTLQELAPSKYMSKES
jgi:hypothetical protein